MIQLITGGSGSGKSVYAENWLIRQGSREACGKEKPFLYIATMRPFGQESRQKILRHRNQRAGKGFATLECYQDLEETRTYQKILGETNQKIGSAADQITEVVYGIPVPVKV